MSYEESTYEFSDTDHAKPETEEPQSEQEIPKNPDGEVDWEKILDEAPSAD